MATLPGAWCYRVSTGTGQPGVSILWLGEVECLTSISVWQHVKLSEQIRPWHTLACCWDVKQPTNKQILAPPHLSLTSLHLWNTFKLCVSFLLFLMWCLFSCFPLLFDWWVVCSFFMFTCSHLGFFLLFLFIYLACNCTLSVSKNKLILFSETISATETLNSKWLQFCSTALIKVINT